MTEIQKNKIKFLITFLKEKNAYCKFKNNLLKQKGYGVYNTYLKKNFDVFVISNAFFWLKTKEGHGYWEKIHDEYSDKYFKTFI